MALPSHIREIWIEIQKHYSYPVCSIGVMIDPRDADTLKIWRSEGIERFMKAAGASVAGAGPEDVT